MTYINTFCYEVNYSTYACILFQWAIYMYIHVHCTVFLYLLPLVHVFLYTVIHCDLDYTLCTVCTLYVYMCMCKTMCIVNVVVILCMCYMLVAEFASTCWLVHVHVPDAFLCTTTANYDRIWPYLFS